MYNGEMIRYDISEHLHPRQIMDMLDEAFEKAPNHINPISHFPFASGMAIPAQKIPTSSSGKRHMPKACQEKATVWTIKFGELIRLTEIWTLYIREFESSISSVRSWRNIFMSTMIRESRAN